MKSKAIILNAKDNVATAIASLAAGSELQLNMSGMSLSVKLRSDIPFGHKFSLVTIEKGQPVIKYGEVIGVATCVFRSKSAGFSEQIGHLNGPSWPPSRSKSATPG